MDILDLLAQDNYIIVNKTLMKNIGLENAILLGVLCSYQRSFGNNEPFYREQERIIDDSGLSEYLVRKSIKELKELGFINVTKKGMPAKYYYQIDESLTFKFLNSSGANFDTTCGVKFDTTSGANFDTTINNNNIYNIKDNINKESNINITKEKNDRFHKPTQDELQDYIKEKGYHFSAEDFINYYDSVGWKINKNPMKDWKAACRTWEKNYKEKNKISKPKSYLDLPEETNYPEYKDKNYFH